MRISARRYFTEMDIGKTLLYAGLLIAAAGALVILASKTGINLGKLPGDINIRRKNFSFHFPLVSSIIISIIISLIINIFSKK